MTWYNRNRLCWSFWKIQNFGFFSIPKSYLENIRIVLQSLRSSNPVHFLVFFILKHWYLDITNYPLIQKESFFPLSTQNFKYLVLIRFRADLMLPNKWVANVNNCTIPIIGIPISKDTYNNLTFDTPSEGGHC